LSLRPLLDDRPRHVQWVVHHDRPPYRMVHTRTANPVPAPRGARTKCSTLDEPATRIRAEVNTALFTLECVSCEADLRTTDPQTQVVVSHYNGDQLAACPPARALGLGLLGLGEGS
jgi:hypothetical protein